MLAFGLAVAGCASEKSKEAALAHMGDESPPDFLVGPASVALTNFDGFSATVVSTASEDAVQRTYSGQILEREGRLLFQPMTTAKTKKGKIIRGGMIFIWEPGLNRGEVVSEALQGYAPLAPAVRIAGVAPGSMTGVPEPINGRPCHRVESTVTLSDGSLARVTEWRADDLGRVPVRVRSEQGGHLVTLDLTDIRLELPNPELFVPPTEFTRYDSALALINELLIREAPLKGGPSSGPGIPAGGPENPRTPGLGRSY